MQTAGKNGKYPLLQTRRWECAKSTSISTSSAATRHFPSCEAWQISSVHLCEARQMSTKRDDSDQNPCTRMGHRTKVTWWRIRKKYDNGTMHRALRPHRDCQGTGVLQVLLALCTHRGGAERTCGDPPHMYSVMRYS